MREYRTDEQFMKISESACNGNWSHAAEKCVKYGFFANDLIRAYDNEYALNDCNMIECSDLAILAEMAAELRS